MPNHFLSGKTILITRPKNQADELKNAIEQTGGSVILFPTLSIKPIISDPPTQLKSCDIMIFLSANAVKYMPAFSFKDQKIIAIGPGTAKALSEKNISNWTLPQDFNSEGILELPLLQSVSGKKINILCGENPRPLLKEILIKRGAQVLLTICYRREKPTINKAALHALMKKKIHAIISSSMESLLNLQQLFSSHKQWLHHIPLCVISEKMKTLAESSGFRLVIRADNPTEIAIMKSLGKL